MEWNKSGCFLLGCCILISLSGCSHFARPDISDGLAVYAESIFRRQNALTSQLMMMDESLLDNENVREAELAMHDDCKLLNDYSRREIEGDYISVWFKNRVRSSLKHCDESVSILEALIDDY